MPCFIFMPIFTCYMPILMCIVSSFVYDVLKFLHTMWKSIHKSCQLMCCMLKYVRVASLLNYYKPRFSFLLYCTLSVFQLLILLQHNKFKFYRYLSAVPLLPSLHTMRSYHHLQQPVVLLPLRITNYKAQILAMVLSSHHCSIFSHISPVSLAAQ